LPGYRGQTGLHASRPPGAGPLWGVGGLGGGRSSIPGCQPGTQQVSLPRAGDPGPADHCRTEGETSVGARRRLALPDVPARRCEAPPRPYGFGRRDRNCRSGGVESWVGACRARRGGRRGGWRPGGRPIPPPPRLRRGLAGGEGCASLPCVAPSALAHLGRSPLGRALSQPLGGAGLLPRAALAAGRC